MQFLEFGGESMEENKVNIDLEKLDDSIEREKLQDDFKRDENGKIILDDSMILEVDSKGNKIVSDDFFMEHFKELPINTINESRSKRTTATGGYISMLGRDARSREIQSKGAQALNAKKAQRRSFADALAVMLCQKAKKNDIEDFNLSEDADNLDVIIASALRQSARGNVKAMDFIRDTIGEKPTERLTADVTALTMEDREMLERINKRLEE